MAVGHRPYTSLPQQHRRAGSTVLRQRVPLPADHLGRRTNLLIVTTANEEVGEHLSVADKMERNRSYEVPRGKRMRSYRA